MPVISASVYEYTGVQDVPVSHYGPTRARFDQSVSVADVPIVRIGIFSRPMFSVEMELAGRGGGWTDVTNDVVLGSGGGGSLSVEYGIKGSTPLDLVASTGEARFTLNNAETNSSRLRSLYSPGHVNCRAGFGLGIRVRIRIYRETGESHYKHVGRLVYIQPQPGLARHSLTQCQSVDWMDEAARTQLPDETPLQIDKRSDEVFSQIYPNVLYPPDAVEVQTGQDTYPYALDTERAQSTVIAAFQDLASSEQSRIYVKGDPVQGGTLVYESRRYRAQARSVVFTLSDASAMQAYRSVDETFTRVFAVSHPRRVDAAAVVLFKLQSIPQVAPGESYTILASYRDPAQEAARVGGTGMVTPVATTDYQMNTQENGGGTDITANFSVVAQTGASGVRFTITNNGTGTGFVTLLQIRGRGIYDFENATAEAKDDTSIISIGERALTLDLKYQDDFTTATEIANYILQIWKNPFTQVASVTFLASSPSLLDQAVLREVSDRIRVEDPVTGISSEYFINAVRLSLEPGGKLYCTWTLAPADTTSYWFLEVPGASELDITTRLGFGLVLGHTDIAHVDTHTDVAHVDTAHTDSHTDSHDDSAHGDSTHTDTHSDSSHTDSHLDVTHADTPHTDLAHSDAHSDIAHSDTAHDDSHTDTAHGDVVHDDSHDDITDHADYGDNGFEYADHTDGHSDFHGDTTHSDTAHSDLHGDSHADVAHADSHGDVTHQDTAHGDVLHEDSHSDVDHTDAHGDAGHTDQAHVDAHSDVAHGDVLHGDTTHADLHTDTPHGDAT